MELKEYKKQFTEKKCIKRLQKFPYFFKYEYKDEGNKYLKSDDQENIITDLDELFKQESKQNILQIQAACLCIQMGTNPNKALSSTPPPNPDADDASRTKQALHLKYLGIKDWINTHIQLNRDTCSGYLLSREGVR